eukprot:2989987-Pleurochrysis_carterae.AAC.1
MSKCCTFVGTPFWMVHAAKSHSHGAPISLPLRRQRLLCMLLLSAVYMGVRIFEAVSPLLLSHFVVMLP